jgi:folylpolyglutamate synthase/dihydropteroate synthase
VTTLLGGWVSGLGRFRRTFGRRRGRRADDSGRAEEGQCRDVLAVASATLALRFSVVQVADGLRSFDPSQDNPGRMNISTLSVPSGVISVVIDLAHNEAGLEALLEIMNGLRPRHGRLLLGVGTAGDRSDDVSSGSERSPA